MKPKGSLPIIEYAFVDSRVLKKREDIIRKIKKGQAQSSNELMNNYLKPEKEKSPKPVTKKEDVDAASAGANGQVVSPQNSKKTLAQLNRKNLAKLLTNDAIKQKNDAKAKEAFEAIAKLKSRGLKQRLFNRLHSVFPDHKATTDPKIKEAPKQNGKEATRATTIKPPAAPSKIEGPPRTKRIQKKEDPGAKMLSDIKKSVKASLGKKNSAFDKILESETALESNFLAKTFAQVKGKR